MSLENTRYKFRGKRVDNGEWVVGNGIAQSIEQTLIIDQFFARSLRNQYKVLPETVGQYTGLKDKNGKKVFEGDILDWDKKEWGDPYQETCVWDYELLNARKNDWGQWCEVIGTIHDKGEQ